MDTCDLLVIGAGIAGLSVAYAAAESGLKTVVAEAERTGNGSSGTPLALLNPATGRKAKRVWQAESTLPRTKEMLERISRESGLRCYTANGVLRPALDEKMAAAFQAESEKKHWPNDWIEWLDKKESESRYPGLHSPGGALWIPVACTVSMPLFLEQLSHYLTRRGVRFHFHKEIDLKRIEYTSGAHLYDDIRAGSIIFTGGQELCRTAAWSHLPLHRVKGQTWTVKLREALPFACSLSSLGYLAQRPDHSDRIVLGSTYEHDFEHEEPDTEGRLYLFNRLAKTLPGIGNRVIESQGWAGVRVTTPDKRPFAGRHPEIRDLYAVGGLGSKGLMLAPTLGKAIVELITDDTVIPEPFRIERLHSL